jgi:hypothetical protein
LIANVMAVMALVSHSPRAEAAGCSTASVCIPLQGCVGSNPVTACTTRAPGCTLQSAQCGGTDCGLGWSRLTCVYQ